MTILDITKASFSRKYNIKDLEKMKIIIRWQITRNLISNTMKINQSAFI